MEQLRSTFLNVPLDAVLHPASSFAQQAATEQKAAAGKAPVVSKEELTAQQWFEQGLKTADVNERLRSYGEAIRLNPQYADAFLGRGGGRVRTGDLDGAFRDYSEAIRLNPNSAIAYYNRGNVRGDRGDLDGALRDYSDAIRLNPGAPSILPISLSTVVLRARRRAILMGRSRITARPFATTQSIRSPSITGATRAGRKATWMGHSKITTKLSVGARPIPTPS